MKIAYLDDKFLSSEAARPLRILAEYLEPLEAFRCQEIKDTIVFFGSARLREEGPLSRYYHEARALARLITEWSMSLAAPSGRYVVCSGGGGGIMEAANRGAADAGGRSIGLNISLPYEQRPNPYITPGLGFEFHYFFMRKLWFAHLARALIVFPGGFGTLDELTEILTLAQTKKLERKIPILLYGASYWNEIINFQALIRHEVISAADLELFSFIDEPPPQRFCTCSELSASAPRRRPRLSRIQVTAMLRPAARSLRIFLEDLQMIYKIAALAVHMDSCGERQFAAPAPMPGCALQ